MTNSISSTDGKRPGPRQAVILIHGIGEQRPMGTLRAFVDALLDPDSFHSKPDTISQSYELRRIKLRRVPGEQGRPGVNVDWPETDFYEYYWAHQMQGTNVGHLVDWLRVLMGRGAKAACNCELFRPPYHSRIKWLVAITWLGVPPALVAAVWFAAEQPAAALSATAAVVLLMLLKRIVAPILATALLDVVGDAARYLDVSPKNVARRYDIIRGGVDMLRNLHKASDKAAPNGPVMFTYGRIVLVGHSLGSVIAYDLIRHYWAEVNGGIRVSPTSLDAIARFDGGNEMPPGSEIKTDRCFAQFREDQSESWRHVNSWWLGRRSVSGDEAAEAGRGRWLVTDLVTVGAPLAYAPLLLADGAADLSRKQRLRELPTCPPDRSRHVNKGGFVVNLSDEAERFTNYPIIGHQAPFAITRWTNLFFSNDPIGGPLRPAFLDGIEEHPLKPGWRHWGSSHVSYWKTKDGKPEPAESCVQELQKIFKRNVMEPERIESGMQDRNHQSSVSSSRAQR